LDLAYSLPKALYTLFYLLQSSLDGLETPSGDVNSTEDHDEAMPTLEVNQDSSHVLLSIPIPTISDRVGVTNTTTIGFGTVKKVVSIIFSYDATGNQVLAECSPDHDMGNLLTEVFPGDTGEPSVQKNDNDETEDLHTHLENGRSYNWCNYLAGLHLPPSSQASQPEMHRSASVVLRTLIQRVRAQATLSWILHALSRKPHPLPVHPAMKDAPFCHPKDSLVKLLEWTEDSSVSEEESSSIDFYLATLKRRSATLTLRIGIYSARYPSVPPTWELNPEHHAGGDPSLDGDKTTLYDEQMATLERCINQDVEQLVLPSDETTYEWILAHQLSEIATKWDQQQTELESV
jgi:hypothetical protein